MRQGDTLVGLKHGGNAHFTVYDTSCYDDAFNAPVNTLLLQIGVGVSIVVSVTFSQGFLTLTIFSFQCFCELSFKMSNRRPLTL